MESLSRCLSAHPPLLNPCKNPKKYSPKTHLFISNCFRISSSRLISSNSLQHESNNTCDFSQNLAFLKPRFALPFLGFTFPASCFAAETTALPTEEVSGRINLESILVSIDDFFNRYPFFVATVVFIWLVAIPLTEEYLQKYKFISAINAFKKLQNEPDAQLLDIRDSKSIAFLGSPNLKILSKKAAQVEFREGDEDGFVKRVLQIFGDPANTTLCILDNFDGASIKVAELLVKNGFKEAYAIRGGVRGNKGWQEIQETLLPPSVHIYPKKKTKVPKEVDTNGGTIQKDENKDSSLSTSSSTSSTSKEIKNDNNSVSPTITSKGSRRAQSPYPHYPDLKPPSSPTPSKPK